MSNSDNRTYWLDNPGNVNKLFYAVVALTVVLAIPDILALFHILYDKHPKAEMEEIPFFYGLYAMICMLVLLGVSNSVSSFLKRDEDYYD
ncbi:MAG: hypothetical protein V7750_01435 [Sneathiella sp.]